MSTDSSKYTKITRVISTRGTFYAALKDSIKRHLDSIVANMFDPITSTRTHIGCVKRSSAIRYDPDKVQARRVYDGMADQHGVYFVVQAESTHQSPIPTNYKSQWLQLYCENCGQESAPDIRLHAVTLLFGTPERADETWCAECVDANWGKNDIISVLDRYGVSLYEAK